MAEELTDFEKRLYEYLCKMDFVTKHFHGSDAAKALGVSEDEVYCALACLTKKTPKKLNVNYRNGGIQIITAD
ncbi:MAG: hypothetical protein PHH26_06785 [Candidatus Thermoplasmatota archaeon]|nr:hypothetical protein [Candidatus Thermoplasmatota archaeon]